MVNMAANQLLPDTIIDQVRVQMLSSDDRYLQSLIAHYFNPSDSSSYQVQAIAGLPADLVRGKKLMYSNCLV